VGTCNSFVYTASAAGNPSSPLPSYITLDSTNRLITVTYS